MADGKEKQLFLDTPPEIISLIKELDGLITGAKTQATLPYVGSNGRQSTVSYTIDNLQTYISKRKTSGIFTDADLNKKALEILGEAETSLAREGLQDALFDKKLADFTQKLNALITGAKTQVELPYVGNDDRQSTISYTSENLQAYIEKRKLKPIFVDASLNKRALEVLNEVTPYIAKKEDVAEKKSDKMLNDFAQQLYNLITGAKTQVELPYVGSNDRQSSASYALDTLASYISKRKAGSVFKEVEINKTALGILDEIQSVLDYETKLGREEVRLVKATPSLEILATQKDVRTESDVKKKELILEYARVRRRLLIKLSVLGLLIPTPSLEQIKSLLEPLETADQSDRNVLNELSILYGSRLVEDFRQRVLPRALDYKPGTRRILIEEAQALLGTGFVRNGNQQKIGQILEAVVANQRRYFELQLSKLIIEETLSEQAIDALIDEFEAFNADDLSYKANLRLRAFGKLRNKNKAKFQALFRTQPAEKIVSDITALPEEYPEDLLFKQEILDSYKKFVAIRKDIRIADYNYIFQSDIEIIKKQGAQDYEVRNVGRNREGAQVTRDNFKERLLPLLQVFEGDKEAVKKIAAALSPESRKRYVINLEELQKQRELTPVEEAWFRSAELTSFNVPYLVGLVSADREVAIQHLEYLFAKISRETKEGLNQIQYFPSVVVGLGPNGMAAVGEIRRLCPQLLEGTLVIDQARNPGGPFAVPESASFNLNSQAPRATEILQLPDKPTYDEGSSIQGYVSPLQALPGQRTEGEKVIRTLSINQIDPSLIADKDIAGDIYPTNEDLEIVVQLLAAVSIPHLALTTKLIRVQKNTTPLPGSKLLTLEITQADGTKRTQQITTDLLITSTGLGEQSYGFDPKGKRAERVIQASEAQTESIHKVTGTLEVFRGLGGRFEEEAGSGLGRIIGIGGKGNSFDTVAEKLVGKFVPSKAREQAKKIRELIGKIYVFAPNPPRNAREYLESQRSRYANLADFIDRGDGKGDNERLITFIDARVSDFDFSDTTVGVPTRQKKVIIYNQKDEKVVDQYGKVIELDNYFPTTGFQSAQDQVFGEYAKENGQDFFEKVPLTLSSAPRIQVGETLSYDDDSVFIGTGSVFASDTKLQDDKLIDIFKVSPEAADALLRVGAKNLVAVGVKSRDAVAAVNDFIWRRRGRIASLLEKYRAQNLDKTVAAKKTLPLNEEIKYARISNQLSTQQKELFAASVLATQLEKTLFREEDGSTLLDRDYVFEFTKNDLTNETSNNTSRFSISQVFGSPRDSADTILAKTSPLKTKSVGVFTNELASKTDVINKEDRITRASNVRTGSPLVDVKVPDEILASLEAPHFVKSVLQILPFSDTGKCRVRVSVRQGRVLPQRTQVRTVNEF